MKFIKNLVSGAALLAAATLSCSANLVYYSDNLVNPGLIINASGTVNGTTTNLVTKNYSPSDLPDGWMSTKGITPADVDSTTITFEIASMQLPTGYSSTYTNAGFVYTNSPTITATVVPQIAQPITLYVGLMLDAASKGLNLPPSTNEVIAVAGTASASTNTVQNWVFNVPGTNFLGAQFFKVLSVQYGGSNALQIPALRAGLWYNVN